MKKELAVGGGGQPLKFYMGGGRAGRGSWRVYFWFVSTKNLVNKTGCKIVIDFNPRN